MLMISWKSSRELIKAVVHLLVLLLPDMYRLLDPSVHSVAVSVDDFGLIPIYDVVEGDSMICEYFCQISSKSIPIILSYTVSNLVHF